LGEQHGAGLAFDALQRLAHQRQIGGLQLVEGRDLLNKG